MRDGLVRLLAWFQGFAGVSGLAAPRASGWAAQTLGPGLLAVGGRRARTVGAILCGGLAPSPDFGLELESILGQPGRVGPRPVLQLGQAFICRGAHGHLNSRDRGKYPSREHGPGYHGGADSGGFGLSFGRRESSWPPGSKCPGIGPAARTFPASQPDGGSVPANRRRCVARSGKEYGWPILAPAPKARAESGCYWRSAVTLGLVARLTNRSTDPVGHTARRRPQKPRRPDPHPRHS